MLKGIFRYKLKVRGPIWVEVKGLGLYQLKVKGLFGHNKPILVKPLLFLDFLFV